MLKFSHNNKPFGYFVSVRDSHPDAQKLQEFETLCGSYFENFLRSDLLDLRAILAHWEAEESEEITRYALALTAEDLEKEGEILDRAIAILDRMTHNTKAAILAPIQNCLDNCSLHNRSAQNGFGGAG